MIVHGRDVNDTRQAASSFRQLTSRNPPPVSVTFNAACQRAAAGTSFPTPVRSGVARNGALEDQVQLDVIAGGEHGEHGLMRRKRAEHGVDRRPDGAGDRRRRASRVADELDGHRQPARPRGAQRRLKRGHQLATGRRRRAGAPSVRASRSTAACRAHCSLTPASAGSSVPSAMPRSRGSASSSSTASLPRRSCLMAAAAARSAAALFARAAWRTAMVTCVSRVGRNAANAIRMAAMMYAGRPQL